MNAVTDRGAMVKLHVADGEELAVVDVEVLAVDALGHVRASSSRDLVESTEQPGDQVESHDDDDQRERRTPHAIGGVVDGRGLSVHNHVRVAKVAYLVVDHAGQRALEAVEQIAVGIYCVADQDEQRRGFAGHAGDSEHDAGDDAGERGRYDDSGNGLPFRYA